MSLLFLCIQAGRDRRCSVIIERHRLNLVSARYSRRILHYLLHAVAESQRAGRVVYARHWELSTRRRMLLEKSATVNHRLAVVWRARA